MSKVWPWVGGIVVGLCIIGLLAYGQSRAPVLLDREGRRYAPGPSDAASDRQADAEIAGQVDVRSDLRGLANHGWHETSKVSTIPVLSK